MKFLAGLLLGLLLAGPSVENHYHITETNRLRFEQPKEGDIVYEISPTWQAVDGSEACVIDLLGGPLADWDAQDVLEVLNEAWAQGVDPCDLDR